VRRGIALMGLVLAASVLAASAAAQSERLSYAPDVPEAQQIVCVVEAYPAFGRPGAAGWVDLRVVNPDSRAHVVHAALETPHHVGPPAVSATRSIPVEPDSSVTVRFPIHHVGYAEQTFVLDADGFEEKWLSLPMIGSGHALTVLALTFEGAALQRMLRARAGDGPRNRENVYVHVANAEALPDRWTWLSGFDAVVADPAHPGMAAAHWELLRQYAAAGGMLVLLRPGELPEGALAQACREAPQATPRRRGLPQVPVGMGELVLVDGGAGLDDVALWLLDGARWERSGPQGYREFRGGLGSPVLADTFAGVPIPGLGQVPVRTFFGLIALFVVVAGPVNLFVLWRRRRLTRLVVTVPLLGFGFTAAILAYGFFGEGFGIRGAVRTTAVLDQENREVAVVASRTLYAGMSPSRLTPRVDTWVFSDHVLGPDPARRHALGVDLDSGEIGGAILPSRQPTTLASSSVTTERARLRFRADPGGGLTVLPAGDVLRPAAGKVMVVRGPDGRWYVGDPDGALAPADDETVDAALTPFAQSLPASFVGRDRFPWHGGSLLGQSTPLSPRGLFERRGFVGYVMFATAAPGFDDLGLDVQWESQRHAVVGLCGEEDFDG